MKLSCPNPECNNEIDLSLSTRLNLPCCECGYDFDKWDGYHKLKTLKSVFSEKLEDGILNQRECKEISQKISDLDISHEYVWEIFNEVAKELEIYPPLSIDINVNKVFEIGIGETLDFMVRGKRETLLVSDIKLKVVFHWHKSCNYTESINLLYGDKEVRVPIRPKERGIDTVSIELEFRDQNGQVCIYKSEASIFIPKPEKEPSDKPVYIHIHDIRAPLMENFGISKELFESKNQQEASDHDRYGVLPTGDGSSLWKELKFVLDRRHLSEQHIEKLINSYYGYARKRACGVKRFFRHGLRLLEKFVCDTDRVYCPPLIAKNKVFIVSHGNKISIFNCDSGKCEQGPVAIGDRAYSNTLSMTLLNDEFLLIRTGNKEIRSISIDNLKVNWTQKFEHEITTLPILLQQKLYIGSINGFLYEISPSSGKIENEIVIGMREPILTGFTIEDDLVLLSRSRGFTTLMLSSPDHKQEHEDVEGVVNYLPSMSEDKKSIFFSSNYVKNNLIKSFIYSGELIGRALDLKDRIELSKDISGELLIAKEMVYVPCHDGTLFCYGYNSNHEIKDKALWEVKLEGNIVFSMIFSDELIFVPCKTGNKGKIHCLEANSGQCHCSIELPSSISSPPVLCDGKIFVTTDEGLLYAYGGY